MLPVPFLKVVLPPDQLAARGERDDALPKEFPRALARALNAGRTAAQKLMVERVAAETGLGKGVIRRRVFGKSARVMQLFSMAVAGSKEWSLSAFSPVQTKTGVTVKLGGRSVNIPHAFRLKTHSGDPGGPVFMRATGVGPSGLVGRLPIEKQLIDSVTQSLLKQAAEPDLMAAGEAAAMSKLESDINRLLGVAA